MDLLKYKGTSAFGDLEELDELTEKFHVLHYLLKYIKRQGDLRLVDASTFEYFSFIIKTFIRMTFMQNANTFDETFCIINSAYKEVKPTLFNVVSVKGTGFSRDGVYISRQILTGKSWGALAYIAAEGRNAHQLYI